MRSTILKLWQKNSPLCFDREESLCLHFGVLISTPTLYLAAIPCHSSQSDESILSHHQHTRHQCQLNQPPDMWHIVAAAGHLPPLLDLARQHSPHITKICYTLAHDPTHRLRRRDLKHFKKLNPTDH